MSLSITLHQRPHGRVVDEIIQIATLLTEQWFTTNVPDGIRCDLLFQDVLCLYQNEELESFLMFTSLDGCINITLMGSHPHYHGQGYGSMLMERLLQYAVSLGFSQVVAMTVPDDVKPVYQGTIAFYRKHGFVEKKRYHELWESGAVELVKSLSPIA